MKDRQVGYWRHWNPHRASSATVRPSVKPATSADRTCSPGVPGMPQRSVSDSTGVGVVQAEEVVEEGEVVVGLTEEGGGTEEERGADVVM